MVIDTLPGIPTEGSFRIVEGVKFTFTQNGGYNGKKPEWVGEPLAHNIAINLTASDDPAEKHHAEEGQPYRVCNRVYRNFEKAAHKAIKRKLLDVDCARKLVAEYDTARAQQDRERKSGMTTMN